MNEIKIDGRLVRDPEVKSFSSGKSLSQFSIAVSHGKDKDASFFDVKFWTTYTQSNFHKADYVTIDGYLVQERWESKTGEKRSKIVIVAKSVLPKVWDGQSSKPQADKFEDDIPF